MTIDDDLSARLKDAMRAKDRPVLDAIRNARTELQRARSEPGYDPANDNDDFVRQILAAYVKKLRKALENYAGTGERGAEAAAKLQAEIDYLSQWLPQALDEAATRELVRSAIADLGVTDPKQSGKVIGAVMKTHRDVVDSAVVQRVVAEELAG